MDFGGTNTAPAARSPRQKSHNPPISLAIWEESIKYSAKKLSLTIATPIFVVTLTKC